MTIEQVCEARDLAIKDAETFRKASHTVLLLPGSSPEISEKLKKRYTESFQTYLDQVAILNQVAVSMQEDARRGMPAQRI